MPTENSNKITAIIVDDELHGRENLKQIIETYCPELEILGLADSVVAAKALVSTVHPEVVFLDINMPILDGFDFLKEYDERSFMVVFVSAHEEFGIHAVKAGAVDYLMKPISIKELKQTVKKLCLLQQSRQKEGPMTDMDKLVIPDTHGFNVLNIEDILRLEADGCYTTITTKEGKTTIVSRTLKDFENTLSKYPFFRTHKSHLINLKYIKDFSNLSGNFVTLTDGSKVEISRRKTPDFIQKVKSFLKTV
ncbi:MAG: LytTR family DNA-binding domain-containing protein [Bacteroidetes bacterium]|nr:LytTR family DNA-binding domain-containing protein [Bacteroidota bacterium]